MTSKNLVEFIDDKLEEPRNKRGRKKHSDKNENIEKWKDFWTNWRAGVWAVLLFVKENFSGLKKVIKGLFPICVKLTKK